MDVGVGVGGDEVGEGEGIGEEACAGARPTAVLCAGGGDAGDAHPEGVEGGGVSVVGEGVEAEVDAVVELEVFGVFDAAAEVDAVVGDALAGEEVEGALAEGAFEGEGVGGVSWAFRGGCGTRKEEGSVGDFAEVVEAAEGEVGGGEGGEFVDGGFGGEGVEAPRRCRGGGRFFRSRRVRC